MMLARMSASSDISQCGAILLETESAPLSEDEDHLMQWEYPEKKSTLASCKIDLVSEAAPFSPSECYARQYTKPSRKAG